VRRWRTAHAAGLILSFVLAMLAPGIAVAAPAVGTATAPAECPEIAPGPFGVAPAGGLTAGTCRRLQVPAPGSYLVDPRGEQNAVLTGAVYGPTGTLLCESIWCTFPTADTYTLVVEEDVPFAVSFHSATAGGCAEIGEQGLVEDPYQGSHTAVAEVDCLQLPSTAGAFRVFRFADPLSGFSTEVQLIRPSGRVACGTTLFTAGGCPVSGSAPLRLLVFANQRHPAGDYALAVQRMDNLTACPAVPQTVPNGAAGGVALPLSSTRFAGCFAIPAGQHAARELVTLDRITGTGTARFDVYGSGRQICSAKPGAAAGAASCRLADGANTVVVQAVRADATSYRIGRVDAAPATGCRAPTATEMGGRATEGTLSEAGQIHCYRVGGPAAIGLRTTGPAAQVLVTDAAGDVWRCPAGPCGSRGDHVFVAANPAGGPASYQLDTWTLAGCLTASLARDGGGEISGALTGADRADCLGFAVADGDGLQITITGPGSGAARPVPYLVNPTGPIHRCVPNADVYLCRADVAAGSRTGLAHLMLSAPGQPDPLPYQARVECGRSPCGGATIWVDGVTSAIGPTGVGTVTLQGAGFDSRDTVTLTRPGHGSIPTKVRTVSADGTVLTADVTVAGAAAGAWDLSVQSFRTSGSLTMTGVVPVIPAQFTATKAPSISGAVRVGSTVRAQPGQWTPAPTAYAYQWWADQVAIKGATGATYTVPAALRGKRLTVAVTAKRPAYQNTTRRSAAAPIGWGIAPKATKTPKITGTVRVGRTVQASVGAWSPKASAYRYEWRLNGKVIKGAAAAKLKIKKSWAGKKLTVVVTAKRAGHTDGRATSAAVKIKR